MRCSWRTTWRSCLLTPQTGMMQKVNLLFFFNSSIMIKPSFPLTPEMWFTISLVNSYCQKIISLEIVIGTLTEHSTLSQDRSFSKNQNHISTHRDDTLMGLSVVLNPEKMFSKNRVSQVALAGTELSTWTILPTNLQSSAHLYLPSAAIKGIHHYIWPDLGVFKVRLTRHRLPSYFNLVCVVVWIKWPP